MSLKYEKLEFAEGDDLTYEQCYPYFMDVFALIFYAVVCGLLGFAAPQFPSPLIRIGFGAVVGIVAASLLPLIKALF